MCLNRGPRCGGRFSANGAGSHTAVGSEAQDCGLVWGPWGPRAVVETRADLPRTSIQSSRHSPRPLAAAGLGTATWGHSASWRQRGTQCPQRQVARGARLSRVGLTRQLSESERTTGDVDKASSGDQEDAAVWGARGPATGEGREASVPWATRAAFPSIGRSANP